MNGSTDVRSNTPPSTPRPAGTKTDTPLPLDVPQQEIGSARARSDDRLISGIDLIDFGAGGLTRNKVYVVKGALGVGKSILGLQFLTRGLEHGEPGVLITDQRPANVLTQAKSVGFPIEDAVKRNQLSILNPSQRYFDLVESPADVMAIVEELGDHIRAVGATRLVVDPIYTLINTAYSSHFALTITQTLMNGLEDLPVTTLLIAGDEDNAELNPIVRMMEQNAFGVIALAHDPSTGGRVMRLPKLRHASTENLVAHYRILNGRGLINYRGEGEQVSDVTAPWEASEQVSRKVMLLGAPPETIRRVKEALGDSYEIQAEADLRSGVERVRRENPALVLVTPSQSVNAIGAILDLAQHTTSSVAFLSPASNRHSDRVLYLRAGADDFISEPFNAAELRARVDALIRRSGRRLTLREGDAGAMSAEDLSSLMSHSDGEAQQRKGSVLEKSGDRYSFDQEFSDRLSRNIDTVAKLDQPFALYWMKGAENDKELCRDLAKLCRQEDIVCHNRNGEFVAILTGSDENGVRGFENRLQEKLGRKLESSNVRRGYSLHKPGEPVDQLVQKALG